MSALSYFSHGSRSKNWWLAGIALISIGLLSLLYVKCSDSNAPKPVDAMSKRFRNFDSALWKMQHNSSARNNPRIGMVATLEAEVLKPEMLRSDVADVLGLPETAEDHADIYDLGASPFGIDYEQYVIEYDDKNRVVRFYIRRG